MAELARRCISRYDILNNTWVASTCARLAVQSSSSRPGWTHIPIGCPPGPFQVTYIYDLGSKSWIAGPNTNLPHAFAAGIAVNGRLFVIGGSDGSATDLCNVESFDVSCSDCPAIVSETFDTVSPPALPNGWIATNAQGPEPLWTTSALNPDNLNNTYSITASTVTDKRLDSPGIVVNSPSALVSFRSRYQLGGYGTLSPSHDGAVLEISSPNINGGMFTDVTDPLVGGYFLSGGYSEIIANGFLSPIAGRHAWASYSGVDLLTGFFCSLRRRASRPWTQPRRSR